MTGSCAFCAIVGGAAEASLVYDDDLVVAFMDIRPVNPGHVLVVPRRHASSLLELDDEALLGRTLKIGREVAAALPDAGVRLDGFNLFLADGPVAGQTVFHVHLHVLPRFVGDGMDFQRLAMNARFAPRAELDEQAERIRRAGGWKPGP